MKNKNYIENLSKHGVLTVSLLLIQLVVLRLTLPFGDEPDFTVRSLSYSLNAIEDYLPRLFVNSMNGLQIISNCKIEASPLSSWGYIDHESCFEGFTQIITRIILQTIIVLPILFILIFRLVAVDFLKILTNQSGNDLNKRIEVMGFSLLVPGMIYYLGLLSPEQLSLMVSLLIYLFWGSPVVVVVLLLFVYFIDLGNSIVVAAFLIYFSICYMISRIAGVRWALIFSLASVLLSYIMGDGILFLIDGFGYVGDKASAMIVKNEVENLREKYPVLLRPVITFMSMVFMLPSGIKNVFIYVIYAIPFVNGGKRILYGFGGFGRDFGGRIALEFISSITFILSFVFMFPDYNNAKYYMFLIPFFVGPIVLQFNKYLALWYMAISFISVPLFLLLFRL